MQPFRTRPPEVEIRGHADVPAARGPGDLGRRGDAREALVSVQAGTIGSFSDSMIQAGSAIRSSIGATLARA